MNDTPSYGRIELLFKRSRALPPLPTSVPRLIRLIDTGEASAIDLDRIVSCDPALTADLLRTASLSAPSMSQITTIRGAIMRLGQRSVRAMAVSLLLSDMFKKYNSVPGFDPAGLASHSLFVGYMARYLFARRHAIEPFQSNWTADEVFAAGVMHDLPFGALAIVAPSAITRVAGFARRAQKSFGESFELVYERPLQELGAIACSTWGLPPMFETALRYFREPWEYEQELTAMYCLSYANFLAESSGFVIENWQFLPSVFPEVKVEVGLEDEEIAHAVEAVAKLTRTALEASYAA